VNSDRELCARLHPPGRRLLRFRSLSPVQRLAIPRLLSREPILLVAPTASGKTEAVIAPLMHLWSQEKWRGTPSILYVAPTRALVNDMHRRLAPALAGLLAVGRRTAEHHEVDSELLITTPESLDSMLVRGEQGSEHPLSHVQAVVLDELHLLAESARGTQLQILLSRLDAITGRSVLRVGLTATVTAPERLAARFLGSGAAVCSAGGGRSLRVDRSGGDGDFPERPVGVVDPLADQFWRIDRDSEDDLQLADRFLSLRGDDGLKALVFVPSRRRCDRLAADLHRAFAGRATIQVHAHHGSLDQGTRERAEAALVHAHESVAVATSTLEVGIDVGEVRLVALDGPPGSVSSLLQRIGRANRRASTVHVIPMVGNDVEACIMASMLRAAVRGDLDATPETTDFSVAIQQLASMLRQAPRARLARKGVERLLASAFGERASWLVGELLAGGVVRDAGGSIAPTDALREIMESDMRVHANIGAAGHMVPLVDAVTGEPLAWVSPRQTMGRLQVAGASYVATRTDDGIELRAPRRGGRGASVSYGARRAPVGRTALRHLALGLGLKETALVQRGSEWVHFGGALFARLLSLAGIASDPLRARKDPRPAAAVNIAASVSRRWEDLEPLCGFGPFQSQLPRPVRKEGVILGVSASGFEQWVRSLEVATSLDGRQAAILDSA
jgi:ATP-dependent Lhr-like helicase